MVTAGLDANTQLLNDPAHHKQSMCQQPPYTSLSASFGRWATLGSPNHPAIDPSNTTVSVVAWVLATPAELVLHVRPQLINLTPLQSTLLVLASTPVPLHELCPGRLPLRSPLVVDKVGGLTL